MWESSIHNRILEDNCHFLMQLNNKKLSVIVILRDSHCNCIAKLIYLIVFVPFLHVLNAHVLIAHVLNAHVLSALGLYSHDPIRVMCCVSVLQWTESSTYFLSFQHIYSSLQLLDCTPLNTSSPSNAYNISNILAHYPFLHATFYKKIIALKSIKY